MSRSETIASRIIKNLSVLSTDRKDSKLFGYALLSPPILIFIIISLFPILFAIYLSFHSGLGVLTMNHVGLENYTSLMSDGAFWSSFWIGIIFALYTVTIQMVFGVGIALVLNENFKFANLVRTIVLVPYLIPTVAVVVIWNWILDQNVGLMNYVLESTVGQTVSFFGETMAMHSLSWAASWKFTIFVVLLVLARLQSIDQQLYEAAKINGASPYRRFIDVTWPNIKSIILLVLLLRLIWMFNRFDIIWLFTEGGPFDSTTTLAVLAYERAFISLQYGTGAAITTIMFVFVLLGSIIYFVKFKPEEEVMA